jgi:hypothetical protein
VVAGRVRSGSTAGASVETVSLRSGAGAARPSAPAFYCKGGARPRWWAAHPPDIRRAPGVTFALRRRRPASARGGDATPVDGLLSGWETRRSDPDHVALTSRQGTDRYCLDLSATGSYAGSRSCNRHCGTPARTTSAWRSSRRSTIVGPVCASSTSCSARRALSSPAGIEPASHSQEREPRARITDSGARPVAVERSSRVAQCGRSRLDRAGGSGLGLSPPDARPLLSAFRRRRAGARAAAARGARGARRDARPRRGRA